MFAKNESAAQKDFRHGVERNVVIVSADFQLMLANQAVRGVPWMVYVGRPLEVVYAEARSSRTFASSQTKGR